MQIEADTMRLVESNSALQQVIFARMKAEQPKMHSAIMVLMESRDPHEKDAYGSGAAIAYGLLTNQYAFPPRDEESVIRFFENQVSFRRPQSFQNSEESVEYLLGQLTTYNADLASQLRDYLAAKPKMHHLAYRFLLGAYNVVGILATER